MAIFRNVQLSFWTDPKIVDDFTPEDRYFFLYILTNPHTNLCGCYEISTKQMSDESGYSKETIAKLISRMQEIHKSIIYDTQTKELLVLNWSRYNWTSSAKFRIALNKEIQSIKNQRFREYLDTVFSGEDTVSIPYPNGMDTTDTDTVTDTDAVPVSDAGTVTDSVSGTGAVTGTEKRRKRFKPPTVDEVQDYIDEKGYCISAQRFIDYYQSNGWMVGRNHMKDWKATVRGWNSREQQGRQRQDPLAEMINEERRHDT